VLPIAGVFHMVLLVLISRRIFLAWGSITVIVFIQVGCLRPIFRIQGNGLLMFCTEFGVFCLGGWALRPIMRFSPNDGILSLRGWAMRPIFGICTDEGILCLRGGVLFADDGVLCVHGGAVGPVSHRGEAKLRGGAGLALVEALQTDAAGASRVQATQHLQWRGRGEVMERS
jgi:hypothetical protein